jgi:outer membrane murein-binding lipoprotein Lpp
MDVTQNPQLIKELSLEIWALESKVQAAQRERHQIELSIDQDILTNKELKNEAQRKTAACIERLTHAGYQELSAEVDRLESLIVGHKISRQFYRDEITVAKLMQRHD